MKWHELTVHGRQALGSKEEILERTEKVDEALGQLLKEIAEACGANGTPLARAVGLRSRVAHVDSKKGYISSRYEGLNQLIHYSYCLVAARRLHESGCTGIEIIPCARDSREGPDVQAVTRKKETVAGEVFCVAPSLFRAKLNGARQALARRQADIKFVFFNRDAHQGKGYRGKAPGIAFYSYDPAKIEVSLESYLAVSGKPGCCPLGFERKEPLDSTERREPLHPEHPRR